MRAALIILTAALLASSVHAAPTRAARTPWQKQRPAPVVAQAKSGSVDVQALEALAERYLQLAAKAELDALVLRGFTGEHTMQARARAYTEAAEALLRVIEQAGK